MVTAKSPSHLQEKRPQPLGSCRHVGTSMQKVAESSTLPPQQRAWTKALGLRHMTVPRAEWGRQLPHGEAAALENQLDRLLWAKVGPGFFRIPRPLPRSSVCSGSLQRTWGLVKLQGIWNMLGAGTKPCALLMRLFVCNVSDFRITADGARTSASRFSSHGDLLAKQGLGVTTLRFI